MADRQDKTPGDLPLFSSGWGAGEWEFGSGDEFWQQVSRIGRESALAEQMDEAMAGKSSPRVWLIMHEPEQPVLSAVAALGFARELAGRDQAVLVLDCDDQVQSLTAWAARLESEGWIDLARYGTSVLTSGVPMPFDGRRGYFLGVGSFAPTDVTAAEIEQMVKRLRRQADDLILVAPADHIGRLWAPVADIRLLCWDRATRPAADLEGVEADFAGSDCALTGLIGYGLPVTNKIKISEEPVETEEDQVDQEVDEEAEVDADPVADDFETPDSEPQDVVVDAPDVEDSDNAEDEDTGWQEAPALAATGESKGTSPVFWFLAVAAVVIVGIMSLYWFEYGRETEPGESPVVALAEKPPVAVQQPIDRAAGELANQDGSSVGPDEGTDNEVVPPDTMVVTKTVEAETDQPDLGAAGPFARREAPATEPATRTPVEAEAVAKPAEPEFTMAPYRVKVGSDGWALHLYSFPDTTGAQKELAELHRRGFETEIRVVETLKKGRWWRVYVGSFASRAEARAAAPLLKKKLRTDWANPTRF